MKNFCNGKTMNKKGFIHKVATIFFLLLTAVTTESCYVLFEESFFKENETIEAKALLGTWFKKGDTYCNNKNCKKILTIQNNPDGSLNIQLGNRKKEGGRKTVRFIGKPYKMDKIKFLSLRILYDKDDNNNENSFFIFQYKYKKNHLLLYRFSKRAFLKLKQKGILEGHTKGSPSTLYITSPVEKLRGVIHSEGIENLIEKRPRFIFIRE